MWRVPLSLLPPILLGLFISCLPVSAAPTVQLIYNSGSPTEPYVVSWTALPGATYDILATEALGNPWTRLNSSPISATAGVARFVDAETGIARFYLVVEKSGVASVLPQESLPVVLPRTANLRPGAQERFNTTLPAGHRPLWTVEAPLGVQAGSIDANGLYTAPGEVPEIPVALIRVRSDVEPARTAFAVVAIRSDDTAIITRDQAIERLKTGVINNLTNAEEVIAFGLQERTEPHDDLRSYTPPGETGATMEVPFRPPPQGSWFFLIDEAPFLYWAHPVRYVHIDALSGAVVSNRPQQWFPTWNGVRLWNRILDRERSPDRVFVGASAAREVAGEEPPAPAPAPATRSRLKLMALNPSDAPPIPRMFPPDSRAACSLTAATRRYALVGVMSPEESVLATSGLDLRTLYQANGFNVTFVFNGDPAAVLKRFEELRSIVTPKDVVVVHLMGHGIGGGIHGLSTGEMRDAFGLLPTRAQYFIMDACYSGAFIDILEEDAKRRPVNPRLTVLSASDADSGVKMYLPVLSRGRSSLTEALLLCFSRVDGLQEVLSCLTSWSDIRPLSFVFKASGPRLVTIDSADADNDSVPDRREQDIGLNPSNPDSDGDGVCDAIEWGRMPNETAQGLLHPRLVTQSKLGSYPVNQPFSRTLLVTNVIAVNNSPPSDANPFGDSPGNGWRVAAGSTLPPGLVLDRRSGQLAGTFTASGEHRFKIEFVDAAGSSTAAEFFIEATARSGLLGASITVSTAADNNARDDDITLREAVLLATGKLTLAALRADPNPLDGVSAGELRWVEGVPGPALPDTIRIDFSVPFVIGLNSALGPLEFSDHGDVLNMEARRTLQTASGPVAVFSGSGNFLGNAGEIRTGVGPALVFTGSRNGVSQRYKVYGQGAGPGVILGGEGNAFLSSLVSGFECGILITGRLSVVQSSSATLCGDGIRLEGGASDTHLERCNLGFRISDGTAETLREPNSGAGIRVSGGSVRTTLFRCAFGSNLGSGMVIEGPGTVETVLEICEFGAGPGVTNPGVGRGANTPAGLVIRNGAQTTSVNRGTFTLDNGPSLILDGVGTTRNQIGIPGTSVLGPDFSNSDPAGVAVVIQGGAQSNTIFGRVLSSATDGIVIRGEGTRANLIASNIRGTRAAGIRITEGASQNLISNAAVSLCAEGLVIEGAKTHANRVFNSSFFRNSGDGVRLAGATFENVIGPQLSATANQGSGVVISGANTRLNLVQGPTSLLNQNTHFSVVIRDGAVQNSLSGISSSRETLGGLLLDGLGTDHNELKDSFLLGNLGLNFIPPAGFGIVITNGARANRILRSSVSYYSREGILITGPLTQSNLVLSCTISLGLTAGITLDHSPLNQIGAPDDGANTINGQAGPAILLQGLSTASNRILANVIGGSDSRNASHGIWIRDRAHHNLVGGPRTIVQDPRSPAVLLPPTASTRGHGNLISGNDGDGIRLEGAGTTGNRIQGNLIGTQSVDNRGHGIGILDGATGNIIGNEASPADIHTGRGNVITSNTGAAIFLDGAATLGHSIRRTSTTGNSGGRILATGGANRFPSSFTAEVNAIRAVVSGTAPARGIVEVFSDLRESQGVFHLSAVVGPGDFEINQLDPRLSRNAGLLDNPRPIRIGESQWVTFTELDRRNTSSAVELLP